MSSAFQRMVLISQNTYELKYQTTATTTTTPAQTGLNKILEQPNVNDENKRIQYLNSWQPRTEQIESLSSIPSTDNELLELIPLTYKKNAQYVLQRLRKILVWDNNGVIIYNQSLIPGSNIIDILNFIVRQRKNVIPPTGWHQLHSAVLSLNLPREVAPTVYSTNHIKEEDRKPKYFAKVQQPKWLKSAM